jgi:hypothetical protein
MLSKIGRSVLFIIFGWLSWAQAYHGLAMVVNGDVEHISHGESQKLKVGARIFQGDTLITSAEAYAKIVMSDRNVLSISAESKVTINKYENDAKVGIKDVVLQLENGSLRCDVKEKYDTDKNKFQVKTQTVIAGVRGTDFLVTHEPTSATSEVTTFKGIVSVQAIKENVPNGEQVMVKAGQTIKVDSKQAPAKATDLSEKDLSTIDKKTAVAAEEVKVKSDKKDPKKEKPEVPPAPSKKTE